MGGEEGGGGGLLVSQYRSCPPDITAHGKEENRVHVTVASEK